MTKLADEADAIADRLVISPILYDSIRKFKFGFVLTRHEEESETIVSTAQAALDMSNAALESIQDAITTLNTLIDDFEVMNE